KQTLIHGFPRREERTRDLINPKSTEYPQGQRNLGGHRYRRVTDGKEHAQLAVGDVRVGQVDINGFLGLPVVSQRRSNSFGERSRTPQVIHRLMPRNDMEPS